MKYLLIFLVLASIYCSGQEKVNCCFKYLKNQIQDTHSEPSKSNSTYLEENKLISLRFGLDFNHDNVKVKASDTLVFDGEITTNKSIGASVTGVYLKENERQLISIIINNEKEIQFFVDKNYRIVMLNYYTNSAEILYSNSVRDLMSDR